MMSFPLNKYDTVARGCWGKLSCYDFTCLHLRTDDQAEEATSEIQFKRLHVYVITAVLILLQHRWVNMSRVRVFTGTEQSLTVGLTHVLQPHVAIHFGRQQHVSETKALPLLLKQLIYVWSWTFVFCGWNAGNSKDPSSACPVHTQTSEAGASSSRRRPTGAPTAGQGGRMFGMSEARK